MHIAYTLVHKRRIFAWYRPVYSINNVYLCSMTSGALAAAEPLGALVAVPPELLPLLHVRIRGTLSPLVLDQGARAVEAEP